MSSHRIPTGTQITKASPPIEWIIPASILILGCFVAAIWFGLIHYDESIVILEGATWLGGLGWSVWVTVKQHAGITSIIARSYLLVSAFMAVLLGVMGACTGLVVGFSSQSGGDWVELISLGLLGVVVILLGLGAIVLVFRIPRKS